ncbi:MAG: DUF167 family protein [Magnetococcus sp. DMHC-6]
MSFFSWQGKQLFLSIRVNPRATREGVMGWQEDHLRIALNAPPVDGAANKALGAFLAKQLGVSKSQVILIIGEHSREKRVQVVDCPLPAWLDFLQRWRLPCDT